jgi:hypothetical protein
VLASPKHFLAKSPCIQAHHSHISNKHVTAIPWSSAAMGHMQPKNNSSEAKLMYIARIPSNVHCSSNTCCLLYMPAVHVCPFKGGASAITAHVLQKPCGTCLRQAVGGTAGALHAPCLCPIAGKWGHDNVRCQPYVGAEPDPLSARCPAASRACFVSPPKMRPNPLFQPSCLTTRCACWATPPPRFPLYASCSAAAGSTGGAPPSCSSSCQGYLHWWCQG